jgi:hypothetical protein
MPPTLACKFTTSELAVLRIVGDAVREGGCCTLCIDAIAARAGVCRRTAQNAIRTAAGLGLLTVQERRMQGQKNLPNVLRVVSREWAAWLRIGCKKIRPTDNRQERTGAALRPHRAAGEEDGGSGEPHSWPRKPLQRPGR